MRWVGRGLVFWGVVLVLVTVTPLVTWWSVALAGPWEKAEGETLIVLGGDSMGEGILGYTSYVRSYYAVRVWREGGVREVLVLGRGISGPMRDYMIQHGIPAELVVAEEGSTSTRENALAAKRLLGGRAGKRVLLTSEYHMGRAAGTFRKVGLEVVTVPCPDAIKRAGNWAERWGLAWDLALETGKGWVYWWRGWR